MSGRSLIEAKNEVAINKLRIYIWQPYRIVSRIVGRIEPKITGRII